MRGEEAEILRDLVPPPRESSMIEIPTGGVSVAPWEPPPRNRAVVRERTSRDREARRREARRRQDEDRR